MHTPSMPMLKMMGIGMAMAMAMGMRMRMEMGLIYFLPGRSILVCVEKTLKLSKILSTFSILT